MSTLRALSNLHREYTHVRSADEIPDALQPAPPVSVAEKKAAP